MTHGARRRIARLLDTLRSPTTLVLAGAYLALVALYAWQASRRPTITIFTDELEFAQLSRSIADAGHAALRGQPRPFPGLAPYLLAPFWRIDDLQTAYAAVKVVGVLAMTAVIFPTYALARLMLSRPWALAVAIGAAVAPALSYSPFLVEEPFAYPTAALAVYLVVRFAAWPGWTTGVVALAGCILAMLVRTQLGSMIVVLAVAAGYVAWRSGRMRRWRATWAVADWISFGVLVVGALFAVNALASHRSDRWYVVTTFFKQRMFENGFAAAAALAIGVGLLPVVAGLAALTRRGRMLTEVERAFALVAAATIFTTIAYAAIKGAYLSTVLANLVVERNVIYLVPVLFVGAAVGVRRGDVPSVGLVAAALLVLYAVVTSPYLLATFPNYEAHGLAIAALANREFRWPDGTIQTVLVVLLVGSVVVLVGLKSIARHRMALLAPAALAVALVVFGWNLTTEVYAARGENGFSKRLYESMPRPPTWIDAVTGGRPTAFLGQRIDDATPLWQLEFWNRSLQQVWSLDATAPGPGPTTTPNLLAANGELSGDPDYVVAQPGIELANPKASESHGGLSLYRTNGHPRLTFSQSGVYPDGWMGESAAYAQYAPTSPVGFAKVTLSRLGWGGTDIPGKATVRIGPVGVDANGQPTMKKVTGEATGVLHAGQLHRPFLLRVPRGPWRVEVTIDPTFVPHELDHANGDARQLGAQVGFGFVPLER